MISDLIKPRPNQNLRVWLGERDEHSLFLSVLTLGEIRQGIELKRADSVAQAKYQQALADFQARFAGRVLDVNDVVAEKWGELNGRSRLAGGGPLSAIDSLIAATAVVHGLIIVTGNVKHFERTGVTILNPFEDP